LVERSFAWPSSRFPDKWAVGARRSPGESPRSSAVNVADKEMIGAILLRYGIATPLVEKFDEKRPLFWTLFRLREISFFVASRRPSMMWRGKGELSL